MKISIIVPAFNEEKMIDRSLAAIRDAASAFEGRAQWELIVCDNNSKDRTAEIARRAGATVVFEPVNQISRARNRGASAATGDWLIFVDADSFPTARLFQRAIEEMANPRCAGGGCLLRLDEVQPISAFFLGVWNSISRLTGWAAGSFIFCDAQLFRELGGFSERLFASEEIDFCQRLKRLARARGRKLRIIRDARLVTSARKMHLYTRAEHLRFLLKAAFLPGRILTSREECALWYNGRR
jgi:glycosyltransferase involved in cell wall biosynthesis